MIGAVLRADPTRSPLPAPSQKTEGFFGQPVLAIGAAVGALVSLGAVVGFLLAVFVEVLHLEQDVEYGEWIGYSGGLFGLLALLVELAYRLS